VLGQTIPKTGVGTALPLLIGGVILAATSLAVRRVLAHRT
jgi:LPXTG-motif cell wall-anchored protein